MAALKHLNKSEYFEYNRDAGILTVKQYLGLDNAREFAELGVEILNASPDRVLTLNLKNLEILDSAGAAAFYYLDSYSKKVNTKLELSGITENVKKKLELFKPGPEEDKSGIKGPGFFEKTGDATLSFWKNYLQQFLLLTVNVSNYAIADLFRKKKYRKGEFVKQAVKIGVNAVPIVLVMTFIIGLVLALQSASQLRNFGADVFIVDLIVIAMMGEMGPLITAILVAGRSGSSIAAEIATMKVTSELDALQTMGLNPLRFIVLPKLYGSIFTLPFLTILANVSGILGGALAAYIYLDISPATFFSRMGESLYNKDIITGMVKSIVFANIIVLTGSFYGFHVDKGAEGVGRVTTQSVVVAISLVIVADMILGLLFY